MKQCSNGHIYDEKLHSSCPYCRNDGTSGIRPLGGSNDFPSTLPLGGAAPAASPAAAPVFPKTTPLNAGNENIHNNDVSFPKTTPLNAGNAIAQNDAAGSSFGRSSNKMSKTVSLGPVGHNDVSASSYDTSNIEGTVNPVCGWLVAVDGEKLGYSFNIHSERNTVGRGEEFDINIFFDGAVSSKGDAVIAFDSIGMKFYISPGSGKNNVHVNNSILLTPVEIKDYDRIRIGMTTFAFRSFCGEQFMY